MCLKNRVIIGMRGSVAVGLHCVSQVARTLIATISVIIPPPFRPPAVYFSHRMIARIKKLIQQKLIRVNPSPDPVSNCFAQWWPFWIFEVLIEGIFKNIISKSWSEVPINPGLSLFQTPQPFWTRILSLWPQQHTRQPW